MSSSIFFRIKRGWMCPTALPNASGLPCLVIEQPQRQPRDYGHGDFQIWPPINAGREETWPLIIVSVWNFAAGLAGLEFRIFEPGLRRCRAVVLDANTIDAA